MNDQKNPDMRKQEREQVLDLGTDLTRSGSSNIYTLTIIGQIEGHQVAPETVKTTKYEHILPLLAGIEESEEIDGLLSGKNNSREVNPKKTRRVVAIKKRKED